MDESLDKEFVQRARIATAIACIATRPEHLTTREHAEQLCRKYQESQLCLKEKYEDAQLEILQLQQKLIMTHNGGISSLTKMDMKVADSSGPVNCVSSALNPTHCLNQATDFMASPILWEHVKFLHCICSLKTAELLTSTHETDKVIMETLRHTITCVKNFIITDSSLPCLKYISECADCWKHAIPMMDLNFQKEMVSHIRELCNQIITVQLSTDASKNHEKRKQYKDFIVKLAYCDILRETIHDILLCKLEDFARYLRKVSANVPYTATMMSMYEWLQSIQHDLKRPPSTVDNFFQGCIASAVALFVTFPLDTIKRRLQARSAVQPYFGPGMCWFIGGTWACIKAAWKDNGIHSFFKGYFPAFIRVVPYHGVMFLTYEACKQFCLIYNGYSRPLLSGRSHEAIDQHLDQEELEDVDYFAFEKELGGIDQDDFEEDILEVEEESEEDGQEEADEEQWKETIGQEGF